MRRVSDLTLEDRPSGTVIVGARVWQGLKERIVEGKLQHPMAGLEIRRSLFLKPGHAFWYAADGRPIAVEVLPEKEA